MNTQEKMLVFECIIVLIKSLRNDKRNFKRTHRQLLSLIYL